MYSCKYESVREFVCIYIFLYITKKVICMHIHTYYYMSGGQNYLLPAMDMAKVGAPLSVVKVCTSMLCAKTGYR